MVVGLPDYRALKINEMGKRRPYQSAVGHIVAIAASF